jgi:CubicO group peptidase (beta-lactamase class C family)
MHKLKRILRLLFPLAGIASAILFVPWTWVWLWITPLPDTVQEQVNQAIQHDLDGIIVYIQQGEKPGLSYTAGWKNRDSLIAASPENLFKIASISKLYIASAAVKLMVRGDLDADKPLSFYLPELGNRIANAEDITLRMLIQHRSGIPNFTDQSDYPWDHPPKTNRETLEYVLDLPADFAPDSDYAYSNTNYLLLGEIMDTVLGHSHHQFISEEILKPLGLKNTYSLLANAPFHEVMSGYFMGYPYDIKGNDFINPGGSMVATASDVGKFLRALNVGTLLSKAEQELYTSLYPLGHTGLVPGYESFAFYYSDLDAVVVQFVNTGGGISWSISELIYNRIVKILRNNTSA